MLGKFGRQQTDGKPTEPPIWVTLDFIPFSELHECPVGVKGLAFPFFFLSFFFSLGPKIPVQRGRVKHWVIGLFTSRGFAVQAAGKGSLWHNDIFIRACFSVLFLLLFREKKIVLGYFELQFFRTSITNHKANDLEILFLFDNLKSISVVRWGLLVHIFIICFRK